MSLLKDKPIVFSVYRAVHDNLIYTPCVLIYMYIYATGFFVQCVFQLNVQSSSQKLKGVLLVHTVLSIVVYKTPCMALYVFSGSCKQHFLLDTPFTKHFMGRYCTMYFLQTADLGGKGIMYIIAFAFITKRLCMSLIFWYWADSSLTSSLYHVLVHCCSLPWFLGR